VVPLELAPRQAPRVEVVAAVVQALLPPPPRQVLALLPRGRHQVQVNGPQGRDRIGGLAVRDKQLVVDAPRRPRRPLLEENARLQIKRLNG